MCCYCKTTQKHNAHHYGLYVHDTLRYHSVMPQDLLYNSRTKQYPTLYNINVSCFVLSRDVILCALPFILQPTKTHSTGEVSCRLHCRYCNNPEKVDHYNNIKIKYAAVATPGKIQSHLLYKFVHRRRKTSMTARM